MDHLDRLEKEEYQDLLVFLDRLDAQGQEDLQDQQVLQVHLEKVAFLDNLAEVDQEDLLVLLVKEVRLVKLELLVLPGLLDQLAQVENVVLLEGQVHWDL